jgi:cytochrome c biogenesis protein ResB
MNESQKEFVYYTAILAAILAIVISNSGCAIKRVMKNCAQMQAQGFDEYSVCEKQYRIWN